MKKSIFALFLLFSITQIVMSQNKTLYDFKVKDIDGKPFNMSQLKGKKVMIVNVASKCGLTPQYEQLEALYQKYKDKNFIIIGFPSNNFNGQEPGTNQEIKQFCSLNYNVTFPMMEKVEVKGDNKAPIYKWLTEKSENGKVDAEIQWNFQKFLIDENGNVVTFIPPKQLPDSPEVIEWIEQK